MSAVNSSRASRSTEAQFSDVKKEAIVAASIVGGSFNRIPREKLISPACFTNRGWHAIYSAALEVRESGADVNPVSIDRVISANGWQRDIAGSLPDGTAKESWIGFVEADLGANATCLILEDLQELRQKRTLADVGRRLTEGTITGKQAQALIADAEGHAKAQNHPPFVDLAPFFRGEQKQEVPSVAPLGNGQCFLYRGRINEIHAAPSVGKTNIACAAAVRVLAAGKKIIIIDPEDSPDGYVQTLLSFGCDPVAAGNIHYLHNPSPEDIESAITWAKTQRDLELVILDGMAELMAAAGMSEDSAPECIMFLRRYVRPFAESGAAVLISDHVTKSTEGRGGFSRGSGAKLGRYDGIVYEVLDGTIYTPDTPGFVKLKISKDRKGGVGQRGQVAYEVHFEPSEDGGTKVSFKPVDASRAERKPTAVMEKVLAHLRIFKEDSKSGIASAIPSKRETVFLAIAELLKEGRLILEQSGKSHVLKLNESPSK